MLRSRWRNDFPILQTEVNAKPIVYLDSAATAQKPRCVIDAVNNYYLTSNANVHRGLHELSERATDAYESARAGVKSFLNAKSEREIVFTRGATEAINLVAQCYGLENLQPGDEIILSQAAHHANIVPWQNVVAKTGAEIKIVPLLATGHLDLSSYERLLSKRTKIVALEHISNVLGCLNDVRKITQLAHASGAKVLIDAAQSAAHIELDVQKINCDFLVFSGHKLYAPTGIGVLYAREDLLSSMPPYQFGGDMIETVSFAKTTYNDLPYKFEAGTPNIAGAVGLKVALEYLQNNRELMREYEAKLHALFLDKLQSIPALTLVSQPDIGVYSFVYAGVHPHDMATILNESAVAVRAGHHCAMPLVKHLGYPALLRASLGVYNDESDLDALCAALHNVAEVMEV